MKIREYFQAASFIFFKNYTLAKTQFNCMLIQPAIFCVKLIILCSQSRDSFLETFLLVVQHKHVAISNLILLL